MDELVGLLRTEGVTGPYNKYYAHTFNPFNGKLFPLTDPSGDGFTQQTAMTYPRGNISNMWLQPQGGLYVSAHTAAVEVTIFMRVCYSVAVSHTIAPILRRQIQEARVGNPVTDAKPTALMLGYSSAGDSAKEAVQSSTEKSAAAAGVSQTLFTALKEWLESSTPDGLQGAPTAELEVTHSASGFLKKIAGKVVSKLPGVLKFAGEVGALIA